MPQPRSNIAQLHAYAPGEQPQDGPGGSPVIKLNTNENPYPPSPKALQAIVEVTAEQLRKYPSPLAQPFREAAAQIHGLTDRHIIATNGGDELLRLVITTFCQPTGAFVNAGDGQDAADSLGGGGVGRGGVGYADPSYSLYPVLANIHDTPTVRLKLDEDWQLPEDFACKLNEAGCAVAFVVNPHAPTGRLAENDGLAQVAEQFNGVLVIDEAYTNFADHNALALVERFDNVLLLRSMSKGYGLAGLRFGYGIGHPDLIAAMDKARDSYNTDVLSQAAATAALKDQSYAAQTWAKVIDERQRVTDELVGRGWDVEPSQSNFVLATPDTSGLEAKLNAKSLYEGLKEGGILVRYFDVPRLADKLRITIGTPEQNDALLDAIDALVAMA